MVHPASFLAELLLSLSSCISLLVGTFSFLHIFSCLTHLFLVPSPENQIKSLYPLFQGWTDSPGWRVKSLPCCGDNCKDMGKIRKGFVVLTKKAEYTSGRKDDFRELQISASGDALGHSGCFPGQGSLWWGHIPASEPRWRAGPSSAWQEGRNRDESHQEPQSEHSWHTVKLLQRHSWSAGQAFESKAAEGGWALTVRVKMLPRERGQEGLEGAKGAG